MLNRPRLPPAPELPVMVEVVSHLLQQRHRLKDVAAVDCLALAQLLLEQPPRKVPSEELRIVFNSSSQNCLANRLRRLRRAGLVEYQHGGGEHPGYQFLRIGPVRL